MKTPAYVAEEDPQSGDWIVRETLTNGRVVGRYSGESAEANAHARCEFLQREWD